MSQYSQKDLEYLIGLDRVPQGTVPAAWWITVHPDLIDAYRRWKSDYREQAEKVQLLATELGVDVDAARTWVGFSGTTVLSGFAAPQRMRLWEGHPDWLPVPASWRLDRKENRLVPSRKTKADRGSQANKDFAAVRKIPDIRAYLRGLPNNIELRDRAAGSGHIYGMHYFDGERCVMAYIGADPDRCEVKPTIDTDLWQRQKLSTLIALRELTEANA